MRGSTRFWLIAVVLILSLTCLLPATALATGTYTGEAALEGLLHPSGAGAVDERTAMEDEVIRLTNLERVRAGLWPVRKSETLTQIARAHNDDMIRGGFVSHAGSNGFSSLERAQAAGYTPYGWGQTYVGENIAAGLHSPADAVRGWLESPAHRANLMRPEYREIGVGMTRGGAYGTYWTQDFGASPNVFPVYVNGGARVVTNPVVTLAITNESVSGWGSMGAAAAMAIAEDPAFTGAAWQPYAPATQWQLSAGPGAKVVYVVLRDAQGDMRTNAVQVELQPALTMLTLPE